MQVSVEKISNNERRLTIVVPADQVEAAFNKQMNQMSAKANIKGFRPGKAPVQVINQRFGGEARQEALNEVIERNLFEALKQQNLLPVSTPKVETKSILANQPLEFTATFEVIPELNSIQFTIDAIEKPLVDVTEADIDRVLEQLRKQYTQWQVVEDRTVQDGDRVVIDYYAIYEGKSDEENKIQNYPLTIGGKTMLPGFEEGLIGAKIGEERRLNLTFPKEFTEDEKAGKPIEFVVLIKQILVGEMPELNEAFVKQLGIKNGSLDDLKKQISQSLEHERDRLVKEKLKEQVFTRLIEQNEIDVPKSLVAREAKNIHDEVYPPHQPHDHHHHSTDEMDTFNDIAKKRVSLSLLVSEYAKQHKLTPDKTLVEKRIQEIASVYEKPEEVIRWLSTDERRRGIESQILEDTVLEKLMETAPVNEKTMSYADLKGIRI